MPLIQASPAYRDHGAILVTFDESESGALSCCNEPVGPNTLDNGGTEFGDGGGRVGAVMLSPCIAPGTETGRSYNHYSALRWTEDNFDLSHLGYAGSAGLEGFGTDILNRPDCPVGSRAGPKSQTRTALRIRPRRAVAGRARRFRLRLVADLAECREGAVVSFLGHHARTNRRGLAWIRARPGRTGKLGAVARPDGCQPARAQVRVVKPRRRAAHAHQSG